MLCERPPNQVTPPDAAGSQEPVGAQLHHQRNRLTLTKPQRGRAQWAGRSHNSQCTRFQSFRQKARVGLVPLFASGHRLAAHGGRNEDLGEECEEQGQAIYLGQCDEGASVGDDRHRLAAASRARGSSGALGSKPWA